MLPTKPNFDALHLKLLIAMKNEQSAMDLQAVENKNSAVIWKTFQFAISESIFAVSNRFNSK